MRLPIVTSRVVAATPDQVLDAMQVPAIVAIALTSAMTLLLYCVLRDKFRCAVDYLNERVAAALDTLPAPGDANAPRKAV